MKKWKKVALASVAVFVAFATFQTFAHLDEIKSLSKQEQTRPVAVEQRETITPDNLFAEINRVRANYSLPNYVRNTNLDQSAALKCQDMVDGDYYGHKNPKTGKEGGSYIEDVGQLHNGASENLNAGNFPKNINVIGSWMGSPSHRDSILDPQFTEIGFAVCQNPKTPEEIMVVQHKINPLEGTSSSPQNASVQQTNTSSSIPSSCNMEAKSVQDYYYAEILKSNEALYQLDKNSPDSADRISADDKHEGRNSSAKYNYNLRLIEIGCAQHVAP